MKSYLHNEKTRRVLMKLVNELRMFYRLNKHLPATSAAYLDSARIVRAEANRLKPTKRKGKR